jgi:hypothetical protein
MRPHGHAKISSRAPQALAICDRCGFMYNKGDLQWQWDWQQGPRLFNLRIQVCRTCLDVPQESGRTIRLPMDPVPVADPRPENYVNADNPLSALGYNPGDNFLPHPPRSVSGSIGNMKLNGGVDAAFNGVTNKRAEMSAALAVSNSSYQNTVGKNWNAQPSGIALTLPSTVAAVEHTVSSFTLYAPNDQPFLNSATPQTGVYLNGSYDGNTWTTIYSTTTLGVVGEVLTATTTSGAAYPYHQIAIQGDGVSSVYIAQAILNVSDAAPNDI